MNIFQLNFCFFYLNRACVDTTEKGELEKCKVLTNFKDSHEYGTFSYLDMLNYTVRIMPQNKILQIVTDSGKSKMFLPKLGFLH